MGLGPQQFNFLVGTPIFFEGNGVTDPGNPVTIMTINLSSGSKLNLNQIILTCSMTGKMQVKSDSLVIASDRTAPGEPNIFFSWLPARPIVGPVTIAVDFTARPNSPAAVAIESYLMATDPG